MTFDVLQKEFCEAFLERYPHIASMLGYTNHDTEMPPGTLKDFKKDIEQNKYFLEQFQDINVSQLDFDEKISRKLTIYRLNLWVFMDETLEQYVKNPDCTEEVSTALDSLFMRKSADRFFPLLARLEKTPQYIAAFKTRVVKPTRLWTEMAVEAAEGLCIFLHTIIKVAQKEIPQDAEEVENYAKKAEESLKEYIHFLEEILPKAVTPWHMDAQTFDTLLQLRELPYTGDRILALGRTWYKKEQETLQELASLIAPGKSVEEVTTTLKEKHPLTFDDVLNLYKKYVKETKQFIIDNDVLSLPEGEQYHVEVMPEFLRHVIPTAACRPAPAVGEERIGYLHVTPHKDPAFLREHTEPAIINTCVHEGYPGHHVQHWCASMHPHRIRWIGDLFPGGDEMVEGWAHYCEEYMVEKGFYTTKVYQFMQSRDVLWRAARVIVDVQLSRGDMGFDDAVHFLEKTGIEHTVAVGEVKWYTLLPGYPLSYLLGKHLIKKLKEKVKKRMGPAYTDKFFHDTLIYQGKLPLSLFEEVFDHKINEYLTS